MKRLVYFYMFFNGFILYGMEKPYFREYTAVMSIKNRIFEEAADVKKFHTGSSITLEKTRDHFTHYEYQTSQGYFLEMRQDIPMAICCVLGRMRFIKGASVQANGDKLLLERLKEVFGLELFQVEQRLLTSSGGSIVREITPTSIFKIKKIDNNILPDPQFKFAEEYISLDVAKKIVIELSTI